MRTITILAGLAVLAAVPGSLRAQASRPPLPPAPLTLAQVLGEALARHPLILAAEHQVEAARGLGLQAGALPDPSVSFDYSKVTHTAGASELIEFPGKRGLRKRAAAIAVREAGQHLRAVRAAVAFQARQAFYGRLLAERKLAAARQTLAAVERIRAAAGQQFQAGDAARLDVVKADVEVARTRQQVRLAQGNEAVAALTLNILLGRPAAQPLVLQGDLAALPAIPDMKTLLDQAYAQAPALRAAALESRRQARELQLAQRSKYPDVDLGLTYGTEEGVRTAGVAASVAIPLPGRYHGQVEQATGQQLAAAADQQAAYENTTQAVASAYERWAADRALVDSYRSSLLSESATVLAGAEESYRDGESGILVVLDAERTDLQVRQAYAQALYDAQAAAANIILARGGVQ